MGETIVTLGEGLYELGLDDAGGELREGFGGDAANTAVMAATMGARTQLVGRVGDDAVGRRLLAFWKLRGVGTTYLTLDPSRATGIYVNRRGDDGHHRFDYHRTGSAGSALNEADVERVSLDDVACVHFTGIGIAVSPSSAGACAALVKRARGAGGRISFALNVRPRLAPSLTVLRDAAAAADVVFASTEDAALVYGNLDAAVDALAKTAQELVVTDGSHGATLYSRSGTVHHSPPTVDVVDAAGAGDALAGAYLAARVRGESEAMALLEGVVAGALSCRSFGCAASYPSKADVHAGCTTTGGRTR
ncbi:MAG: sugar kinase [Gaiellaceae bacterium]